MTSCPFPFYDSVVCLALDHLGSLVLRSCEHSWGQAMQLDWDSPFFDVSIVTGVPNPHTTESA